jgi:hypothetical protein
LSALANSHQAVMLRVNDAHIKLRIDGAEAPPQQTNSSSYPVQVDFAAGEGYVQKAVRFSW